LAENAVADPNQVLPDRVLFARSTEQTQKFLIKHLETRQAW